MTATASPPLSLESRRCPNCGAPGQTDRFCRQCGARLDEAARDPEITWEYSYPFITNPLAWWDMARVGLFTTLILQGILVVISLWTDGEAMILPWPILAGGPLVMTVLFVLTATLIYWNGAGMEFKVSAEGVGSRTGKRVRRINRIILLIGLLTFNPRVTGAAMIAEAQQEFGIDWRDVYRVKIHRRMRMVSISNNWRTVLRLHCPPALIETVAARCRQYGADAAAWRAANAVPAPIDWGRLLGWTLASLTVAIALGAWSGLSQFAVLVGAGAVALFTVAGLRSGRPGRWAAALALAAITAFAALLATRALVRIAYPWGGEAFAFSFDSMRLLTSALAALGVAVLAAARVTGAGVASAPLLPAGGNPHRWPAAPHAPATAGTRTVASALTLLLAVAAGTGIAVLGVALRPAVQGRVAGELRQAMDAVLFSPDGRAVIAGDGSGAVTVWDIASGLRIGSLATGGRAGALALAGDASALYVGGASGCSVERWELAAGTRGLVLIPEGAPERGSATVALALSSDGQHLAAVCRDGSARVWRLDSQTIALTVPAAARGVRVAAFSPDGRTLATGNADNSVRLWSLDGGAARTLEGIKGEIDDVLFSPDGRLVIAATEIARDDIYVRAWQVTDGRAVGAVTWLDGRAPIALSPDGRTLAVDNLGTITLISTTTWRAERQIAAPDAAGALVRLAFSPDGTRLAGGGDDGQVTIWKVASGSAERVLTR